MKFLLALLFAGKLGKVLLSGGTMILSVFAYSLIWGWRYAAGFVAMLFVHELGHLLAARRRGLAVGAPVFIPFVGAWIALKEVNLDADTEAYVGLAGPLLGSCAALVCYLYARETMSPLLMAIAYAGFFLNLFNLIPLHPLDGGRIVGAITPKLWLVGVPVLVAFFIWRPSPLLVLIVLFAAPQVWQVITGRAGDRHLAVPLRVRVAYGVEYVGLVVGLALLAFDAHEIVEHAHG